MKWFAILFYHFKIKFYFFLKGLISIKLSNKINYFIKYINFHKDFKKLTVYGII
jgi:hypothetical protein